VDAVQRVEYRYSLRLKLAEGVRPARRRRRLEQHCSRLHTEESSLTS